jgi:hypothetical protein
MDNNKIVSVNIMGGLGNQMFQLATAYAYSKKYNINLQVLRNKLENDGRSTYWDSILNRFSKYLVNSIPNNLVNWNENGATEFSIIPPPSQQGGIYLKGYLQSYKYFDEPIVKYDLKKLFEPSSNVLEYINNKYNFLFKNKERVVVVHARRTDNLRNQDIINFHGPLSTEYYKKAIEKISTELENPFFLLSSDDPAFWNSVIQITPKLTSENMYILQDENEVNTLALLQQFNYFIIANSTFSWWATWLSNEPKWVIAPSKWFGSTGPKNYEDIYLPTWERM